MAVITNAFPTLPEVLAGMGADGALLPVAEVLSKQNEIVNDIPWVQGNLPTGHQIVSRTAVPSPTWTRFNQGHDSVVSGRAPFTESCGMLQNRSDIDVRLAELNGNSAAWRRSEDESIVAGFADEVASSVFYASTKTDPEKIWGLAGRYASQSGTTGSYCLKIGTCTTTGCHSMWAINWRPGRIYGFYPKGSTAGLKVEDMGRVYAKDVDSKEFLVYRTEFMWQLGIAVEDYRYAVRSIWDTDDTNNAADKKTLYLGINDMLAQIREPNAPGLRLYMDRTTFSRLQSQLASNSADYLKHIVAGNGFVWTYMGIPIRITDALVSETAAY